MTLEELQKAFKPEFGNPSHINILRLAEKESRKKELIRKTKSAKSQLQKLVKEAEEAEKKLYGALKFDYEKRLKTNPTS